MSNILAIIRTSEFWVGLIAAILQFLVAQHVVSPGISDFINMAAVYVLGRLLGKAAKAALPNQ